MSPSSSSARTCRPRILTSRLLQEARAAARLGHPAIVRVSDFGKTDRGDPYIVMELLNGEDLGAAIKRRGPIQPLRAVRTLLPIADALATAHAKKIVHRDLKPENIFLAQTEDGKTQPKLVDFGIAKFEREDTQRITQVGAAMGSPAYMSPEQARGLDVDPRTDVWAFSVVLYEALTGQLPFAGNSYTALVCSILESQPKPVTELSAGDAELWAIIARGLAKEPDQRWPNMREIGAALARWAMARGAADDLTGASLQSAWIERPPDSTKMGTPGSIVPAFDATPLISSASGTGPSATQLSATLSGQARRKGKPVLLLVAGAAGVLGLGIGIVLVLGSGPSGRANAIQSEPSAPAVTPVAASDAPKIEPAVPSAAEPPASVAAPASAEPPSAKKPVGKPARAGGAAAEKPPQKPPEKPPQKPPEPRSLRRRTT